jgi:hypothetical protein
MKKKKTTNNKQAWSNLFTSSDFLRNKSPDKLWWQFQINTSCGTLIHLTIQSFYFSRPEPRFEDVHDHYYNFKDRPPPNTRNQRRKTKEKTNFEDLVHLLNSDYYFILVNDL